MQQGPSAIAHALDGDGGRILAFASAGPLALVVTVLLFLLMGQTIEIRQQAHNEPTLRPVELVYLEPDLESLDDTPAAALPGPATPDEPVSEPLRTLEVDTRILDMIEQPLLEPDLALELPTPDIAPPPITLPPRPTIARPSPPKRASPARVRTEASRSARPRATTRRGGDGQGGSSGQGGATGQGANRGIVPIARPQPTYPRAALARKQEGWVRVSFVVNAKGRVENAKILASRPRRVFDRTVLETLSRWRFKPKLVDGKPVATSAVQKITFKLPR